MRPGLLAAAALLLTAPAMADQPPKSPVCALLTLDEAKVVMGHEVMIGDDAPPADGLASCGWVDTETFNALSVTVSSKDALGGVDPKTTLESMKGGMASGGKVEDLPGLGDEAFLATPNDATGNVLTVYVAKGESFATINSTGISHDQIVSAARTIGGRL